MKKNVHVMGDITTIVCHGLLSPFPYSSMVFTRVDPWVSPMILRVIKLLQSDSKLLEIKLQIYCKGILLSHRLARNGAYYFASL